MALAWVVVAAAAAAAAATDALVGTESIAIDCSRVLPRVVVREKRGFAGPPPRSMPEDWADAYTRCGAIATASMYIDDTNRGLGRHVKYSREAIDTSIAGATRILESVARSANAPSTPRQWLAWTLSKYRGLVRGRHAAVFGSNSIAVESLLLAAGARHVTVIEYQPLTYAHPQITTHTVAQLRSDPSLVANDVDVAVAISGFDHDGLGRYGDPLCPDGDLLAMDEVAERYLRPPSHDGAPCCWCQRMPARSCSLHVAHSLPRVHVHAGTPPLLLLTVPVGPDVVVWNLHRRYGRVRLPLLLDGYRVLDVVGWDPSRLAHNVSWSQPYEPVWVLTTDPTEGAASTQWVGDTPVRRLATATPAATAAPSPSKVGADSVAPATPSVAVVTADGAVSLDASGEQSGDDDAPSGAASVSGTATA